MLGNAVLLFQYQNSEGESICRDDSIVNPGIPTDKTGEEIKSRDRPLLLFEATRFYADKKATLFSWYPVACFVFASSNFSVLFH